MIRFPKVRITVHGPQIWICYCKESRYISSRELVRLTKPSFDTVRPRQTGSDEIHLMMHTYYRTTTRLQSRRCNLCSSAGAQEVDRHPKATQVALHRDSGRLGGGNCPFMNHPLPGICSKIVHRKSVTWCEVFKNLFECTQANPTTSDQSSEKPHC
jgi:hypothetical protein